MKQSKKDFSKLYEKEVAKLNNRFRKLFVNKKPISLYEPSAYIIESGGKRLRPFSVLVSAFAVSGKFSGVYNAALAVELLHNFTLVHDDIMDNADKRRGKTTVHIKYNIPTAILTGDNLIAYAYKSLLKDCNNNCEKVIETFTQGIIEVCEGQSLDELYEELPEVKISDYKKMIKKKTASLFSMCCSIGARLGGGSENQIKALEKYGLNLGMAFQIQDDYLDLFGDEKKIGKVVGGDLLEGKKTYLLLRALEKAKGKNKNLLLNLLKRKGIDKKEIPLYKTMFEQLNVTADAQKEIKNYTSKALKSLNEIENEKAKDLLLWFANFLLKRNY